MNVDSNDAVQVIEAIDRVYASYVLGDVGKNIDSEQVLIQTQTFYVVKSGVIFTRDINENRLYYLINYDENGAYLEREKTAYPCGGEPELCGLPDGVKEHVFREPWLS